MPNNLKGHLYLFVVALIYASNYSMAKWVMPQYLSPAAFILLRVSFAALAFNLLGLFRFKNQGPKLSGADHRRLMACGFFGVAANMMLFFEGLNLTTPISAALLMLLSPILVLILASLWLKEKLQTHKIIGIALGLGGAIGLITSRTQAEINAPLPWLGNLLVGLNAASYALYLILVKSLTLRYGAWRVLQHTFSWGLLFVLPLSYQNLMYETNFETWLPWVWGVVAFTLFFVTFMTYWLNAAALQWLSPSIVSAYIYLQPLLTTLIALSWGTDQIHPSLVIYGLFIGLGVWLASQNDLIKYTNKIWFVTKKIRDNPVNSQKKT